MKQRLNEKSRKLISTYDRNIKARKQKRRNELLKQKFNEKSRKKLDHETKIEGKK